MFKRQVILIPVDMMQRAVSDFTLSQRHFLSFSADKLEHIMRYYHAMPHGFYYTGLHTDTDGKEYIKFMSGAIMALAIDEVEPFNKKLDEFRQKHLESGVKLLTSGN